MRIELATVPWVILRRVVASAVLVAACSGDDTPPVSPIDGGNDPTGTGSGSGTGGGTATGTAGTGMLDETATSEGTSGSTTATTGSTSEDDDDDGPDSSTGASSTGDSGGTTDSGSTTASESSTGEAGPAVSVVLGDDQLGYIDQQMPTPIVIQVDDAMGAGKQGVSVDVIAPPGAVAEPPSGVSDASGQVVVLARAGRALGEYTFDVAVDGETLTSFSLTAEAPPAGTALTLVNVAKVNADNLGVPGPGTAANIGDVQGVDIATDDTVYLTAESGNEGYVYALDAVGTLTLLAGGGESALEECIDPLDADLGATEDILYDAFDNALYIVAQYAGGWRVLNLDLDDGLLCTVAGGNEDAPGPQYGDGGLATDARLVAPGDISLSPSGALYIADRSLDRIRRVQLGVITEFLGTGSCSDPVALNDCTTVGCEMAWDSTGQLFVDARICGTAPGGITSGIVRIDPDTMAMEHIAGQTGGSSAEPVLSFFAELGGLGGLSFDEAGNLFVVEEQDHRVRRIDTTTWQITTVINESGTEGAGVDYDPATDVMLDDPRRIVVSEIGDLLVADSENSAVRMVWQAGDAMPVQASLGLVSGDNQALDVDQQMSLFITDIQDDSATALEGLSVHYVAEDSGACVRPDDDLTDDAGFSATFGRPGLLPGEYSFRAEYDDIHGVPIDGSPVTITADASAPDADEIFTAVNVDHTSGNLDVPGAGTCARVGTVWGVSAASDGGIYLADNVGNAGRVRLLDPTGHLDNVAGGGSATVDGVPALDANVTSVRDVLLDEAGNRLLLTGTYGGASRVLRVNLAADPPTLFVFAGQPTPLPADGDGGIATVAHLSNAGDLAEDPVNPGAIYVVDAGHGRIRRIEDLVIEHVYGTADAECTDEVAIQSCANCNIAFDGSGDLFIFGQLCGLSPGGNTPGIVRLLLTDGSVDAVQHYAGVFGGTLSWDGTARLSARFDSPGGLLVGSDGNLYFTEQDGHRVGVIDAATGILSVVAGTGSAGATGNYGPAVSATLDSPLRLSERPSGDLVVGDRDNAAVRLVWEAL